MVNEEVGVVPERPWPRSRGSPVESVSALGRVSSEKEEKGSSISGGERAEGGELLSGKGKEWGGSHMVSSGASKNASRYVSFAVRMSNRVFPVPTTVTARLWTTSPSTKVNHPRSLSGSNCFNTHGQVSFPPVLTSMRSVRVCSGSTSKTPLLVPL